MNIIIAINKTIKTTIIINEVLFDSDFLIDKSIFNNGSIKYSVSELNTNIIFLIVFDKDISNVSVDFLVKYTNTVSSLIVVEY